MREYQRFRDFAETSAGWLWEMDRNLRFTWLSDSVREVSGVSPDWHYGKTRQDLLGDDYDEESWAPHFADLTAHRPFRDFTYYRNVAGIKPLWLRVSGKPVFDDHGVFDGYRGSGIDVSAEMEARQSARMQQRRAERLANSIEQMNENFVLWDEDDRLVVCNAGWRNMNKDVLEATRPGTHFMELARALVTKKLVPEALGREEEWIAERLERHNNPRGAFELLRSGGTTLLINEHRIDNAIVTIAVDITAQKNAEREQRQAHKFQAVGQLAGGIVHDFNNLLATVLGNAQLGARYVRTLDNDKLTRYFDEIERAGKRGRDVVKQLLTFSRSDEEEVTDVAVDAVLEEARALLEATIPASINFEISAPDDLPAVRFNEGQLLQIVMNLCLNARDAIANRGSIKVSAALEEVATTCTSCGAGIRGKYLVVSVEDDGEGTTVEDVSLLFHPFFSTKPSSHGNGLGLSMVHGILHSLGGHVVFKSTSGVGSSSRVILPCSTVLAASLRQPDFAGGVEEIAPEQDANIVIVDDDVAIGVMLSEFLTAKGYISRVYSDALEARRNLLADLHQIDLVVTDQTMPGLTGLELARELLRHRADLPILLCTGYSNEVDEKVALDAGIRRFLRKPLDMTGFANHVGNLLRESSQ